jgi:glycosyltransferase involved in cell wall biosynthesis
VRAKSRPTVAIGSNTAWSIRNFRSGLIRGLQAAGYEVTAISPADAGGRAAFDALGIENHSVAIERSGRNPWRDLRLLRDYLRFFRSIRPTAFLGFTIKPNIYGGLAARILSVPAIPNVSGLGIAFARKGTLQRLVVSLYRAAFRRSPVVFFQNREDLDRFVELGIVTRGQAKRLPGSGVDLKRFALTDLPTGRPTFLFVGRMLRDKGVREFVEAARMLRDQGVDARFQLLGALDPDSPAGIAREEFEVMIADSAVDYLGVAEDVAPFLAAATAVVLPSYYNEGVPRSLLEAAAMGRPLITTDFPGCRDALVDGETGYLCKPRDAASLANAMERLTHLSDEGRATMGRASRAFVEAHFDERRVIEAYLEALDNVIGGPAA